MQGPVFRGSARYYVALVWGRPVVSAGENGKVRSLLIVR
jgi:hypothetical protein